MAFASVAASAQTASVLVENASDSAIDFRAESGFQGRLQRPLPEVIPPGETGRGEVQAGFPTSQGGGFRYGRGVAECAFGFLRLRDPATGSWMHPQMRARPTEARINCRSLLVDFSSGGDFTIRFIVE